MKGICIIIETLNFMIQIFGFVESQEIVIG